MVAVRDREPQATRGPDHIRWRHRRQLALRSGRDQRHYSRAALSPVSSPSARHRCANCSGYIARRSCSRGRTSAIPASVKKARAHPATADLDQAAIEQALASRRDLRLAPGAHKLDQARTCIVAQVTALQISMSGPRRRKRGARRPHAGGIIAVHRHGRLTARARRGARPRALARRGARNPVPPFGGWKQRPAGKGTPHPKSCLILNPGDRFGLEWRLRGAGLCRGRLNGG